MCGIAGCVVPPGESPGRRVLEQMAAAIAHRGPDGQGIEVLGSVGLANRRLAIVDPTAAGAQPMSDPAGRWWLTYNGEIFNHAELRDRLGSERWRGHSDTETLVRALAAWGEDAIPRCNGLFAYAALDAERGRLLLVRDRYGVKPLYWARHAGGVWFASEIRALLAAGVPARVRRDVLAHSVVHGWANGPLTPLEGIDRVLPGTVLSIDLETLATSERRWYDPSGAVDAERARHLARRPRREHADAVEEELRASVRRRLMSDVPLGTMCSGGIDSSLVTAFAHEDHGGVVAFNASVADQPEADESAWAARVATALGVELRTVAMTAARWRADLVPVVWHHEYPLMHESSVPMAQIAGLARASGVKVLLSGEGADELFGGYGFLNQAEYVDYLWRHGKVGPAGRLLWGKLRRDGPAAAAQGTAALARQAARRLGEARGDGTGLAAGPGAFPGPSASPQASAYEEGFRERGLAAYAHSDPSRRRLEARLVRDIGAYLPHLLNRQDKNTMQQSIETRVPFLDPALVALSLNLPLEARVEPRRKGVLRDIAARHLPPGVAERPKLGFGFDVGRYIAPAVQPRFVLDGSLREALGVATEAWRAAVGSARGHEVLRMWTAEVWCRLFLEGRSPQRVAEEMWIDGGGLEERPGEGREAEVSAGR